jgi:hypothetical protein
VISIKQNKIKLEKKNLERESLEVQIKREEVAKLEGRI